MANSEKWLDKIAHLRIDSARGDPAPHKPLFLLVLLELAEKEMLPDKLLPLTPELAFRFSTFWSVVAHRRNSPPDIRLPFHHLKSAGFWDALDDDCKPSPKRELTRYASLNSDFIEFMKHPRLRNKAFHILIKKYFQPLERVSLYTLVNIPAPHEGGAISEADYTSQYNEAKKQGREARFRIAVVSAYDYTCALTGYRLTTLTMGSIVDAAHIHQFAHSRNNNPRNGLALSKNAHWLFDQGLWTISDDYTVRVATSQFAEHSPDQKPLCDYHGEKILLPDDSTLWPDPRHLAWHRKNRFKELE